MIIEGVRIEQLHKVLKARENITRQGNTTTPDRSQYEAEDVRGYR